jgi:hypothetical protein
MVTAAIIAYLFPLIVAILRGHRSYLAIGFVTLALGWTGFGWLFAMVWSLTGNVRNA